MKLKNSFNKRKNKSKEYWSQIEKNKTTKILIEG